jgi:hypothetical protein
MDRLQQFAAIENALISIVGSIQRLEAIFASQQPRSAVDEGLIDELVVKATQITGAAEALKSVVYDPTPPEEDPEAP